MNIATKTAPNTRAATTLRMAFLMISAAEIIIVAAKIIKLTGIMTESMSRKTRKMISPKTMSGSLNLSAARRAAVIAGGAILKITTAGGPKIATKTDPNTRAATTLRMAGTTIPAQNMTKSMSAGKTAKLRLLPIFRP